jgi:glycosyltransferase involved in cell wall biosynthesis
MGQSSSVSSNNDLKVLYALGPGDVVQMYRDQLRNQDSEFEMSIAFSKLFLDWCDQTGAHAHLISWNLRRDSIDDGNYKVENIPKSPLYYRSGLRFHLGESLYGLKIVGMAWRERPAVVVVDSGTTYWLILALLRLLRIPVVAVMHSTLWPMGFPPKRKIDRLLRLSDGLFFRRFADATVCVSPECERQVRSVARCMKGPVYQCRAQFRTGFLDTANPVPAHRARPFRVLFVGRTEESKGVFLIVAMAERLEKEMPGQFRWKIVGKGSASEALARQVADLKLESVVEVAGRLPRKEVLEAYGWAHAMVVPTTAQYSEGLAMTAAEAILAGRPVVLSDVVPAWEILGDAAIRVEAGNVDGFVEAFRRLALDADWYDRCRSATVVVQQQFYERSQGLGVMVGKAITELMEPSPRSQT